jgi:hypothetical protein
MNQHSHILQLQNQHLTCSSTNLIWSDPVPKLSSPHSDKRPASIRFPKNFHPVGTSNISMRLSAATLQQRHSSKCKALLQKRQVN